MCENKELGFIATPFEFDMKREWIKRVQKCAETSNFDSVCSDLRDNFESQQLQVARNNFHLGPASFPVMRH